MIDLLNVLISRETQYYSSAQFEKSVIKFLAGAQWETSLLRQKTGVTQEYLSIRETNHTWFPTEKMSVLQPK